MTTDEIKSAVEAGKTVHWGNNAYVVVKDKLGEFLIKYIYSGHCIGLTWQDGVTLNGKPNEFYVEPPKFLWGEETYNSTDEVIKAIESHCAEMLCNADSGSVEGVGEDGVSTEESAENAYQIELSVRLVRNHEIIARSTEGAEPAASPAKPPRIATSAPPFSTSDHLRPG